MGKWLLRNQVLVFLIFFTILIKIFSLRPEWVERYYSRGFFVYSSRFLRSIFGWIPFSVGDILYLLAGIFLVVKFWKLVKLLVKRKWNDVFDKNRLAKYVRLGLGIYIAFNLCWGLNYDRQGIGHQLGLEPGKYSDSELLCLAEVVHHRLNHYAALVDSVQRDSLLDHKLLFSKGMAGYANISGKFPFLTYTSPSTKPSIFSGLGHYFGFTGYINPFTNEAHIKTSQPVIRQPFIITHEIAHQLGYGKEDEANFVGFLVSRQHPDIHFRYSLYFDLYRSLFFQMAMRPALRWNRYLMQKDRHPRIKTDNWTIFTYHYGQRNRIEPVFSNFYDGFLKVNNQPGGLLTYDEVIALLVAYMNKYGFESI